MPRQRLSLPKQPGTTRLVIGRKDGESFQIGDDVTVRVRIVKGTARLAIDAPPHVPITRTELIDE